MNSAIHNTVLFSAIHSLDVSVYLFIKSISFGAHLYTQLASSKATQTHKV